MKIVHKFLLLEVIIKNKFTVEEVLARNYTTVITFQEVFTKKQWGLS